MGEVTASLRVKSRRMDHGLLDFDGVKGTDRSTLDTAEWSATTEASWSGGWHCYYLIPSST